MKVKTENFGTRAEFLMFPDDWGAFAETIPHNSTLAVDVDGRKIVKAGTIYPAAGANARGLVYADCDVTDSERSASIVFYGSVLVPKLPVEPDAATKAALPRITFFTEVP